MSRADSFVRIVPPNVAEPCFFSSKKKCHTFPSKANFAMPRPTYFVFLIASFLQRYFRKGRFLYVVNLFGGILREMILFNLHRIFKCGFFYQAVPPATHVLTIVSYFVDV